MSLPSRQKRAVVSQPARGKSPKLIPTDGELLMRFARHGDAEALALVVDRHSAMVWLVCTRLLANRHAAEDAYQATFLILAKKAGSIRASDSVGGWLFRVAHNTALASRRRRKRRREEPLVDEPLVPEKIMPDLERRQTVAVLIEELRALPERYQTPLVLRYLERQSRRAIADATDATLASVAGRLVRGKRMLRARLARRGVGLSVAVGAFGLASDATGATANGANVTKATDALRAPAFDPAMPLSAASPAVSHLVHQGVRSMLIASLMKPIAATTIATAAALLLLVEPASSTKPTGAESEMVLNAEASKAAIAIAPSAVAIDASVELSASADEQAKTSNDPIEYVNNLQEQEWMLDQLEKVFGSDSVAEYGEAMLAAWHDLQSANLERQERFKEAWRTVATTHFQANQKETSQQDEARLAVVAASEAAIVEVAQRDAAEPQTKTIAAPTIRTKAGQPATIAIEQNGETLELRVTPTVDGETVEIAAEIRTVKARVASKPSAVFRSWGKEDQEVVAVAKERYAKLAANDGVEDYDAPGFEELYWERVAWSTRLLEAKENAKYLEKVAEEKIIPQTELATRTREAIVGQNHAKAKLAELERKLKQAAVAGREPKAPPAAPAAPQPPLPPLPPINQSLSPRLPEEHPHVAHLEELVRSLAQVHDRIAALHAEGARGGSTNQLSLAKQKLAMAQAQLAAAKGQLDAARQQQQQAIEAAEENVKAQQAAYDAGRVTLDSLLEAMQLRADAKAARNRESMPPAPNSHQEPQPLTLPMLPLMPPAHEPNLPKLTVEEVKNHINAFVNDPYGPKLSYDDAEWLMLRFFKTKKILPLELDVNVKPFSPQVVEMIAAVESEQKAQDALGEKIGDGNSGRGVNERAADAFLRAWAESSDKQTPKEERLIQAIKIAMNTTLERPAGRLEYGDGRADGKKSLGGSGHLIEFEMPEGVDKIKALRIHGSRYGLPKAPKEDFEISFLSHDMSEVLTIERAAYGLFRRGDEKWVTVRFRQPIELPNKFWVGLDFDPGRTKGVYVSYDTSTEGKHSKVGLASDPEKVKEVDFKGDWMVQVILERDDDKHALLDPGPIPSELVGGADIRVGDTLLVRLGEKKDGIITFLNNEQVCAVYYDEKVAVPGLKARVKVTGLTAAEASDAIAKKLKQERDFDQAFASVRRARVETHSKADPQRVNTEQPSKRRQAEFADWAPAADSEVHVVGTYNGADGAPLTVEVKRTDKPITLVLTAYYWQDWKLKLAEGVKLDRVIVAGYFAQRIAGVIEALPAGTPLEVYTYFPSKEARQDLPPPESFGGREFFWAYKQTSQEYFDLKEKVEALTDSEIASFQADYSTDAFTIE